jgi:hypothetical protein
MFLISFHGVKLIASQDFRKPLTTMWGFTCMNKKFLNILTQLFNSGIVTSNRNISKGFHTTDLHLAVQLRKANFPARALAKFHFVASIRHLLAFAVRLQSLGSLSLSLIRFSDGTETVEFPYSYYK